MHAFVLVAEILTAGTLLRAAGRVFAGWGRASPESSEQIESIEERPETRGGRDRVPRALLLGIAVGLIPGSRATALEAAVRFRDRAGYLAQVLDGSVPANPAARRSPPPAPPASPSWSCCSTSCASASIP